MATTALTAVRESNVGDGGLVAPYLRSPSPTPEPAKLSPSLKQPQGLEQHTQSLEDSPQKSSKDSYRKQSSSTARLTAAAKGPSKRFNHILVVQDDSKAEYKDIGASLEQTVLLRPPFSLY